MLRDFLQTTATIEIEGESAFNYPILCFKRAY